jgi:YVTN family beta-propeller protein
MSFNIIKDGVFDTTKVSQKQTIPANNLPQIAKGEIQLNPDVSVFYGKANRASVPVSNSVISTIRVGVTPAGIAILPTGTKAYVANNNNYGLTYEGGAACDSVTVIDLKTNKPIKTITDPSFNQPYTITISKDGAKAYVTNSNGSTITIISTTSDSVIGTITGFDGPSGMVITPDGLTGYVNNYGGPIAGSGNGTTVRVVNLLTNLVMGLPITVGQAPAAIAILPNGSYVYTINYKTGLTDGTISVINTSTNSSIVNAMSGLSGPFGISITPDGLRACVTNFGSNNFSPFGTTLSIISLATPTVPVITDTITLGIQPSGVAITPDGGWVYVSNYNTLYSNIVSFTGLTAGEGLVSAINLTTLEVSPVDIVVGQSPDFIAIHPSGTVGLVSNFTSNTVSIFALI